RGSVRPGTPHCEIGPAGHDHSTVGEGGLDVELGDRREPSPDGSQRRKRGAEELEAPGGLEDELVLIERGELAPVRSEPPILRESSRRRGPELVCRDLLTSSDLELDALVEQ